MKQFERQEYLPFLRLIQSVLEGKSIPADISWQNIYLLAVKHQMTGFLYFAMRRSQEIPERFAREISKLYYEAVARRVEQEQAAKELFAALEENNIRYMPLKGQTVRSLYPDPELRQSTDVDVFYDAAYRQEISTIMTRLGYTLYASNSYHEEYTRGRVLIETHHRLTHQSAAAELFYRDIWQRLLPNGGTQYRFTDEDFYIFLLLHARKHFLEGGGCGIRPVLDTYLFRQSHPNMNTSPLYSAYNQLGISRFVSAFEQLGKLWFNGEEELFANEDLLLMGDYIVAGGVFGSEENEATAIATIGNGRSGRWNYLLRRSFPPFRAMKFRYPVLKRCPILLPFFYPLRWFATLFSPRRKDVKRELATVKNLSDASLENLKRIRKFTGLDDES